MSTALPTDVELQRMDVAADWLVRLTEAPDDENLVTQWFQWCQESPDNLAAFKRAQAVWQAAGPDEAEVGMGSLLSKSRTALRTPLAWTASLILAMGAGVWLLAQRNADTGTQSYATPVAGLGSSILPDGSRVELGARSRITTRYDARVRSVSVEEGEAFFTVTKDPARPFIVTARGVEITAIGTAFNVRHAPDRIVITVREGKVRVSGTAERDSAGERPTLQPVALEAGRRAVFNIPAQRVVVAPVPPSEAASWRQGVLKYENEPLSSVAADLSRYSSRRIVVSDPQLARMTFTGTVLSAHIPQALLALQDVFPLEVVRHDDSIALQPR